ncbi:MULTISPECIES: hypothetical protein [Bradyrhizobium]|uniref:Uncharacterized protein n=1 Tax=Bradyrhizobium septentrionale TaxID=1404411 RepID=A0ABZ2NUI9_9BRAD|nr:hypothetical protein [Bradyrhizobium sp. 6(2017)]QIG98171.1 hypothetical protein G6P99_42245 [Bradyrhizobium sp. 6(2017)]
MVAVSEVIAAGVQNVTTVTLADYDIEQQNYSSNFMPNTYSNIRFRPQNIDRWRRGMYQIPGIENPDATIDYYVPPGVTNNAAWVEGIATNYHVLSQADWLTKFYAAQ